MMESKIEFSNSLLLIYSYLIEGVILFHYVEFIHISRKVYNYSITSNSFLFGGKHNRVFASLTIFVFEDRKYGKCSFN